MTADYADFLERKALIDPPTGLTDIPPLQDVLFPFQADIVRWALRRGRAAVFAGTGLGKSLMELAWADAIHRTIGCDALILTPLAVASQMVAEGAKFGIAARHVRKQSECGPGINVTNYEKLDHFDVEEFGAIVLDESSILKAMDGKTRAKLIQLFQQTPYRLAATATPAPNDFMELGNHAEFLGVMSYTEMLAMFFVHDGGETQKWRIKGHAESDFWRWMCSWSVMLRKPSDLGYEDGAFNLPPLVTTQHTLKADTKALPGNLFAMQAETLQERIGARRETVTERVAAAVALVNSHNRPCIVWCNLNSESDALAKSIPSAVEIRGSDSEDVKERSIGDFSNDRKRVVITKPSITGHGLNWQHCSDMVFVGLNDSFEAVFQAIRRCWRFGQTRPVNVHFIASELEGAVVANLARKEAQAEKMAAAMVAHMADINRANLRGQIRDKTPYRPTVTMKIPEWLIP